MGSGIDKHALRLSVYDVLLEKADISDVAIVPERLRDAGAGYAVLGANRNLSGAEVELVGEVRRERRLQRALSKVAQEYDYALIDCPPALNMLTLNGLCAAQGVIVPMQCEYFALEGLADLTQTIRKVYASLNRNLRLIGLLRVMFDPHIVLQKQVSERLKEHYGDKVFDTVIPRNVRLAEAPSHGLPGVVYEPSAKGSAAFMDFARELSEHGLRA